MTVRTKIIDLESVRQERSALKINGEKLKPPPPLTTKPVSTVNKTINPLNPVILVLINLGLSFLKFIKKIADTISNSLDRKIEKLSQKKQPTDPR